MIPLKILWGDKRFYRHLSSLALPIMLQNLMLALVAAGDALMLGMFRQDAMAAVSLATQIPFVQNLFLWAISNGICVLGAQYWGKGDKAALGKLFGICVRKSLLISLFFFLGCFFFSRQLMHLFAQDPILLDFGAQYLRIAALSYLITGLSQSYLTMMRISGHAAASAGISSAAVLLNILFNAVFIFGSYGIPPMGVRGAAVATILARVVELLCCFFLSRKPEFIPLRAKDLLSFPRQLEKDFRHYTLPILGAFLLWGSGFTAYTALMGYMGRDAAAANAVAAVVRDLLCCICNGMAGGIGILVGNEMGAGLMARSKRYGRTAMLLSFAAGLICTLLILLSLPFLIRFVHLTALAQEYMIGMFLILSVYMVGRSVCTIVINGIFSAGGDTDFDVYTILVCMWGVALPCAFAGTFFFHWPVPVVYACTCLDEVGKIPWVIHHFFRYKWLRNITRESTDECDKKTGKEAAF